MVARRLLFSMREAETRQGPLDVHMNRVDRGSTARISFRSVFPVDGSRLAIGQFNRPLADDECHRLRRAWEHSGLPGVEDFEVTSKQVSFVTPPVAIDSTWRSIDTLLASHS